MSEPGTMKQEEERGDRFTIRGAPVNWECSGKFSFTTGYGATRTESAIAHGAAFLAPVALYFLAWRALDWSALQIAVASLLTLDLVGGVLTNSLGSMKRFLHTDQELELTPLERWVGRPLAFPALHLQIFALPVFFETPWSFAFFWYGAMMAAVLLLRLVPFYLHRAVALLTVTASILVAHSTTGPDGLEWIGPVYMIKLVLAHAVREEPYRPTTTT